MLRHDCNQMPVLRHRWTSKWAAVPGQNWLCFASRSTGASAENILKYFSQNCDHRLRPCNDRILNDTSLWPVPQSDLFQRHKNRDLRWSVEKNSVLITCYPWRLLLGARITFALVVAPTVLDDPCRRCPMIANECHWTLDFSGVALWLLMLLRPTVQNIF